MPTLKEKWTVKTLEAKSAGVPDRAGLAKQQGLKHYLGNCKRHGEILFLACDNSCPLCAANARTVRHNANKEWNRARGHYNEIRKRAKDKELEFDLELEWFREFVGEKTTCPVFGLELIKGQSTRGDQSPSIDRFDSSKGYTMDNVAVISDRANRIKSDGTMVEHIKVALFMATDGDIKEQLQKILDQLDA